jgi:hypothetical protein
MPCRNELTLIIARTNNRRGTPAVFFLAAFVLAAFFGLTMAACGGAEDDREATWSFISPVIVQQNCATSSCHNQASAVAGLDLSTVAHGYKSLLRLTLPVRGSQGEKARTLVVPYNPDESRLVNMLRARGANRMPPDRPLPEADIRLVERWILAGAVND